MSNHTFDTKKLVDILSHRLTAALRRLFYATFALSLATLIPSSSWLSETVVNFRFQYVLLAVLSAIFLRPFTWRLSVATVAVVAIHLPHLLPFYFPLPKHSQKTPDLKVLLSNVFQVNTKYDSLQDYLLQEDADIVVLQELTPQWLSNIEHSVRKYPFRKTQEAEGNFGIGVFSKHPIVNSELPSLSEHGSTSIYVEIAHKERQIALLAIHPWPPLLPRGFAKRNAQLKASAEFLYKKGRKKAVLLVGDLNITPFSPLFLELLQDASLHDPRKGRGFIPSFPTFLPPLWLPGDHILGNDHIEFLALRRGPFIGSDHFPLVAEISLRDSTENECGLTCSEVVFIGSSAAQNLKHRGTVDSKKVQQEEE